MKATNLQDWPKVHRKIKRMHGMSEQEKIRLARSLAATPSGRIFGTTLEVGVNCRATLGKRVKMRGKNENRKSKIENGWLPDMDLNHDKQIQSLLCYRYTIGH